MAPNINQNNRRASLNLDDVFDQQHQEDEAPLLMAYGKQTAAASTSNDDNTRTKSPIRAKADAILAKADAVMNQQQQQQQTFSKTKKPRKSKSMPPPEANNHTRRPELKTIHSDATLNTDDDDDSDVEEDVDHSRRRRSSAVDMEQELQRQQSPQKKKTTTMRPTHKKKKNMADDSSLRRYKTQVSSASLPESIAWRVSRSWELVAPHTERVGVDFFLRLFDEHPQAADLFKFGGTISELERDDQGRIQRDNLQKIPRALALHAKKVLDTVGVCVAGLSHLPDLVPTLRSLGKFHTSIGVQPFHYDAIYVHLLNAMEAEVGKDNFDDETRESWEIVYRSLTQVMKNPNSVLQMEPLEGWGTVATAACAYLTIATPLQMAKLTVGNPSLEHKFNFLTLLAAVVLALDMSSHWIANQVRPKGVAPTASATPKPEWKRELDVMLFPIKFRTIRFLRSLQMDRWVQWQKMEATVLLSFPLQYANYWINRAAKENPTAIGVHWTYAFGLLRLVAVHRVFHALACAENNFLLRRRQISQQELSTLRMAKLIVTMLLVVHINSALWCLVARMEFGPGQDPQPSAFFPLAQAIFQGQLTVLNSYLHAVHWAWVNLAGIGDTDSKPETTLECFITLFVHICGATLYTITTGNVVNILESMSAKRNEVGGDLAELGHFMQTCNVPQDIQKRIMQGYMMKKMIGDVHGSDQGGAEMHMAPKSPEAISRLPRHLEAEISLYYRAEAIRRRDAAFAHCSHEFLVAFVGSLSDPEVVLSEETYVKEGKPLPGQVALLVEGKMQVLMDGMCVRYLEAGDLIGKNHLFLENDRITERVGLVAETTCTLMTGLSSPQSVELLQERYARDFSLLSAYRLGQVPHAAMNDLSYVSDGSSSMRFHASKNLMTGTSDWNL